MRKIYLASSWRNQHQNSVVRACRAMGHEVYDFKNPEPGNQGFAWQRLNPIYQSWTPAEYIESLQHPVAQKGYFLDKDGLDWADTCILLLPCGRSAHLEAGYCIGKGKNTAVFISNEKFEPDLMYLMADTISHKIEDIYNWLGNI